MSKQVARLYQLFHPENYQITFDLDEPAMRLRGTVVIRGTKVSRPSQRLTFHQQGLKITSAVAIRHDKKRGDQELNLTRINHQDTLHEVRLHFGEIVYPGEFTVTMEFEAPITDGMTGVYPCYFDHEGKPKKLFATQFESHHARQAFPCVDEPEAKATFDMTLVTAPGGETLGNTPVKDRQTKDGRLVTVFERTPRMSTYLLAFVTGDIHCRSAKTKSGVEVNVWGTIAQPADSFDFALDAAVKSIEYFEDYFDVPYPLAKCDHVGLPDFSSGALENWGLITYRERVLLAYGEQTAQSTREHIALVIAHETSHQWFGNLVTMRWWNNLWLNESFANMMEYQCVDSFYPEWHVWDSFVADEGLSAFRRDALYGVQSVQTEVSHPDEISSLFDPSIVYAKGGRLLYMLKSYVGDSAFRQGLKQYFEKHAYGNTEGDDLWAALSEASGKDIKSFMDPWITRSGYPVLHIEQDGNEVLLSQEHFLDDMSKSDKTELWPVPTFSNEAESPEVISSSQVKSTVSASTDLALYNTGARGHYLPHYVTENQKNQLAELIRSRKLGDADRLLVLSAMSMFYRAGIESLAAGLQLLEAYRTEQSEPVWGLMSVIIGDTKRFIDTNENLEPQLKTFAADLARPHVARLGWEESPNEPAADTKLRAIVIGLSIYADEQSILDEATSRFNQYIKDGVELPSELRSLIMCVPVKLGDQTAFDTLIKMHDATQNSELKNDIADALTTTRDPARAAELLKRLKDSKLTKPQDVDRWLVYLLRNRYTRQTAWQWLVDEWDWLEHTFANDKSYDSLPRYAASCVNTPEYARKFDELFESKKNQPLLRRNIELGQTEIAGRLAWIDRDLPAVQKFFSPS